MRATTQAFVMVLSVGTFLSLVYLAYLCMYLAPTSRLRRRGAAMWGRLSLLGPAWPKEVCAGSGPSSPVGQAGPPRVENDRCY